MKKNIVILGNGSFGSSLALILSKKNKVTLWGRDKEYITYMQKEKRNPKYLPNVFLDKINFESDLEKAIFKKEIILLCIPSKSIDAFSLKLKPFLNSKQFIVSTIKGFVDDQLTTCSQLLESNLDRKVMVLSGPSHAEEIAQGMPTFLNLAISSSQKMTTKKEAIRQALQSRFLKIFSCHDSRSIEIAASLKNIIAIAAGIINAYEFGMNTQSALITKGLEEMIVVCRHLDCDENIIIGLGGLGDLIVTCMSKHSRNFQAGTYLGKGLSLEEIIKKMHMTIEGVNTVKNLFPFIKKNKLKLPIIESIYKILFTRISAKRQMLKLIHSYF